MYFNKIRKKHNFSYVEDYVVLALNEKSKCSQSCSLNPGRLLNIVGFVHIHVVFSGKLKDISRIFEVIVSVYISFKLGI